MSDISSLKDTIVPKSDQLNAEQLLSGPMVIRVSGVKRGSTDEQPLIIAYDGDAGRPYKPCKTMRKVMIFAWGDDGRDWIGRSIELYSDPEVKFGGVKVGGIRISAMSHIDKDISISLTATRGKKAPVVVKKMAVSAPAIGKSEVNAAKKALMDDAGMGMASLIAAWKATEPAMRSAISPDGTCPAALKKIAAEADLPDQEPDDMPVIEDDLSPEQPAPQAAADDEF